MGQKQTVGMTRQQKSVTEFRVRMLADCIPASLMELNAAVYKVIICFNFSKIASSAPVFCHKVFELFNCCTHIKQLKSNLTDPDLRRHMLL